MRILKLLLLLLISQATRAHVDSMKVYLPFYGTTLDWSGWNNNGVSFGATLTTDRNGAPQKAYHFDGFSYMTFPTKNIFTAEYTYAFWTRLKEVPTNEQTALRIAGDSCEHFVSFYADTTGGVGLRYYTEQQQSTRDIKIEGRIQADQWVHVSILNSPDSVEIYLNLFKVYGEELQDYTCFGAQPGIAYLGSYDSSSGFFNGDLDEIRVYTESIPGSELFDAYIQERLGTEDVLSSKVSLYPNPTRGRFQIASPKPIQELHIFDLQGRQVWYAEEIEEQTPIFLDQKPGTYLAVMRLEGMLIRKRLIVQ